MNYHRFGCFLKIIFVYPVTKASAVNTTKEIIDTITKNTIADNVDY